MNRLILLFQIALLTILFTCDKDEFPSHSNSLFIDSIPFEDFDRIDCGPRPSYNIGLDDPHLVLKDTSYIEEVKENPFVSDEFILLKQDLPLSSIHLFSQKSGAIQHLHSGRQVYNVNWLDEHVVIFEGDGKVIALDVSSKKVIFTHEGQNVEVNSALGYFSFYRETWKQLLFVFDLNFKKVNEFPITTSIHSWHPHKPVIY
ncbi:MAG: hypothetical protein KDC92_16330, partial [Bacteroidetes bacterium]|nr:hypothetical protein [Bacteroidota bacterium]